MPASKHVAARIALPLEAHVAGGQIEPVAAQIQDTQSANVLEVGQLRSGQALAIDDDPVVGSRVSSSDAQRRAVAVNSCTVMRLASRLWWATQRPHIDRTVAFHTSTAVRDSRSERAERVARRAAQAAGQAGYRIAPTLG